MQPGAGGGADRPTLTSKESLATNSASVALVVSSVVQALFEYAL